MRNLYILKKPVKVIAALIWAQLLFCFPSHGASADAAKEFVQTCDAQVPRADHFYRTRNVDENFLCEGINEAFFNEGEKCVDGALNNADGQYISVLDLGRNGFREFEITVVGPSSKLSGYSNGSFENHYGKLLFFVGYDCGPFYFWARLRSQYTRRYFDDVLTISEGRSFPFPVSFDLQDFDHRMRALLRSTTGKFPLAEK